MWNFAYSQPFAVSLVVFFCSCSLFSVVSDCRFTSTLIERAFELLFLVELKSLLKRRPYDAF